MFYTGIGCRDHGINPQQGRALICIATWLCKAGMVLRSGHASGSDYSFEIGAAGVDATKTSIYLPWSGFRRDTNIEGVRYFTLNDKAFQWARKQLKRSGVMPYFDSMTDMNQAFHARNVFQVFGQEKIPSDFVVYFAPTDPEGQVLGGTRTAVSLAKKLGIKTYNLKDPDEARVFLQYLNHLHNGNISDKVDGIYLSLFEEK